jgi:hypothetical protein
MKSPCSTLALKGNKRISVLSPLPDYVIQAGFRDGEKRAEIADFDNG